MSPWIQTTNIVQTQQRMKMHLPAQTNSVIFQIPICSIRVLEINNLLETANMLSQNYNSIWQIQELYNDLKATLRSKILTV